MKIEVMPHGKQILLCFTDPSVSSMVTLSAFDVERLIELLKEAQENANKPQIIKPGKVN